MAAPFFCPEWKATRKFRRSGGLASRFLSTEHQSPVLCASGHSPPFSAYSPFQTPLRRI